MTTFKQYLEERLNIEDIVTDYEPMNNLVFFQKYLPLTPKMLHRLGWTYKGEVFHVSSVFNVLKNLIRLQGTKKGVSGFLNISKGYLESGVEAGGGAVSLLKGDVVMYGNRDLYTAADKHGRRWLKIGIEFPLSLRKELDDLKLWLLKKHFNCDNFYSCDFNLRNNKKKNEYIKEFMKSCEGIFKTYQNDILEGLSKERSSINEFIVTNFKIVKVFLIEDMLEKSGRDVWQQKLDLEEESLKVKVVKNIREMQKEIKKIRRKYK